MSKDSNGGLSDRTTSYVTGAIGLVGSLTYIVAARRIEDSLLADAVGASGVPVAVGMLMAVASVALLAKGWALSPKVKTPLTTGKGGQDTPADSPMRPHWLAAGLLALLVVYLVALPWLGYILSIGLLSAAVGW